METMRTCFGGWFLAGVIAGCNGGGDDDVPPLLEVTPLELDFGTVGVGSESTLDVTLTNAGGGAIQLLSVTLVEGEYDAFPVDASEVGTLTAGTSAPIHVTFA